MDQFYSTVNWHVHTHHGYQWLTLVRPRKSLKKKKKESWDMQSLAKMYSFNGRGILTPYTWKWKDLFCPIVNWHVHTHHGYQWIMLVRPRKSFFFFKKKETWDMQSLAKMYSFNGRGIVTPYTWKWKGLFCPIVHWHVHTHHGYQWITLVRPRKS